MFILSCSKDDATSSSLSANQWSLKGNNFSPSLGSSVIGNSVSYSGSSGTVASSLTAYFFKLPTTNGTYTVVGTTPSDSTQVSLSATNVSASSGSNLYNATGYDKIKATVTVTSGKISITIPKVWMKNSSVATDSTQLEANAIKIP